MDSVAGRNTHWTLKDGKLQIKSTGVSGLEDSFKEYYQRDLGGMTFVANVSGRTYYLFENSHKSTERIALVSFEGGLGYLPLKDNPKLAFLNSTPMHNTPLLRGKGVFSDSKNLYLFGSLKGIVKINPSEQTFEMVAGSPSKDAAVANTPENFNAEGLKKFQSGVPIESIGDVQSIVETKDEETVYLDHELGLVMKIDKNGLMSVFAGGGSSRNISSGKTSELQLSGPYGLIQREDGSFLVADSGNNRIVSIKDGFFQTFAGATASSGGNLVSRPNEGSCLSDPTNALGAKIVGPGGMVEDKASKAIYVSLYQPSCVQKITTDGILHTVIGNGQAVQSPDGSVAKDSTVRQPTDVALSSAGELLITEFGEYVEDDGEFVFEEIKIPARIIAIDVNSEQPLLKVISTQIISENRYDRSPYITPASIATGPGGEIFVADVHTFKKDISVLKRQSDGSYKKVSIIERDDGVDCVVGGLSDVSKNNALASSIKTSTSNICTGYPVKLHVHDTCDQADGKVSLTFSQRFFKRDRYLTWSSYSLTNGNSIYKISWPCSADLFAE